MRATSPAPMPILPAKGRGASKVWAALRTL